MDCFFAAAFDLELVMLLEENQRSLCPGCRNPVSVGSVVVGSARFVWPVPEGLLLFGPKGGCPNNKSEGT